MTSNCKEIKQDEMKLGEDHNRMRSSGRRLKQNKMKLGGYQNRMRSSGRRSKQDEIKREEIKTGQNRMRSNWEKSITG